MKDCRKEYTLHLIPQMYNILVAYEENLKIMYQDECNFHLNPRITEEENVFFLVLKEQFTHKMKMCPYPQFSQDVYFFIWTDFENVAQHHLLTQRSSVNGCHQNESPNGW